MLDRFEKVGFFLDALLSLTLLSKIAFIKPSDFETCARIGVTTQIFHDKDENISSTTIIMHRPTRGLEWYHNEFSGV